jgi:DUF4097 and DUF4098 domain-containing protein YvlB
MKTKLFDLPKVAVIAALSVLATSHARADAEDKITKSFQVQSGDQLLVQVDRGSIEIVTADASSVDIEITRKAGGSSSKAEQTLKDHVVTTTQNDNTVEVHGKYTGAKTTGWFGRSPELQVSCRVTVPRQFDVTLKTAGGHIKVAELTGKLKANTSGGNLDFKKLEGPVSAQTSGGHITLAGCIGKVDLSTSGGNLNLSGIEGDVTATTSGGHITLDKLSGKTVVKTSGGNINVTGIKGSIDADTSGGHITVSLPFQPTGNCTFDTSGGNITLNLAEQVAVDIDAHTSGGSVSTELPVVSVIQGKQKNNELQGKINGGGPLIVAHTSGGHIRLEKN